MINYYKLYHMIGQGRLRYYAIKLLKLFRMRHYLIRFDLRMSCNLRCPSCYHSNPDFKDNIDTEIGAQISLEDFKKVAQELFPYTKILYLSCSAEPLTTKKFGKYLEIVSKYNIPKVSFATNGMLLNKEYIIASIGNKVNEIIFSMDGAKKETYEFFRRGAVFEKVIENIRLLRDMKSEYKTNYPSIRFNYVMNAKNINEVPDFIELASSLGGDVVSFRHMGDWGGGLNFDEYSLINFPELYNEYYEKAVSKAKQLNIEIMMATPFIINNNKENLKSVKKTKYKKYGCVNPWFYIYLRPDGLYRPCCYLPFEGNIIETTFSGHGQSEKVKKRKFNLVHDIENSCMANVCGGQIMGRFDENSNLLLNYKKAFINGKNE
ncbi:radical SAM protein [Candidatus Latescibacterota bacterium]